MRGKHLPDVEPIANFSDQKSSNKQDCNINQNIYSQDNKKRKTSHATGSCLVRWSSSYVDEINDEMKGENACNQNHEELVGDKERVSLHELFFDSELFFFGQFFLFANKLRFGSRRIDRTLKRRLRLRVSRRLWRRLLRILI